MKLKMSRETKKLFRVRRKFNPMSLVVPLLLVLLLVCAVVYDNSRIVVEEVRFSMPTLPKDMEGTAILHISDIRDRQFGEEGETLARALEDYDYDLVVMTGDVLGTDGDTTGFYQALDYFAAQGKPVYFITGDNDPPATCTRQDGSFGPADWVEAAQSRGAAYLDVPVAISEGDTRLWLMPASALVLDTASSISSLDGRLADETLDDETVQSILYRKARYQVFADKMEELVRIQVQAIQDLKIDKITVWDSGAGADGKNSTANFLSGLMKSIPPMNELFDMAGMQLPKYMGENKPDVPAAADTPAGE